MKLKVFSNISCSTKFPLKNDGITRTPSLFQPDGSTSTKEMLMILTNAVAGWEESLKATIMIEMICLRPRRHLKLLKLSSH